MGSVVVEAIEITKFENGKFFSYLPGSGVGFRSERNDERLAQISGR